eukprot:jgi/Ulvmu1/7046/UM033_0106.1
MHRNVRQACLRNGAHADAERAQPSHPKRGLKRSPIARKCRQRKVYRRHPGSFGRRSAVGHCQGQSRAASKDASFSVSEMERDDGSDCDEALQDCLPVPPEEVFDLIDEQTAIETEEDANSDSDVVSENDKAASGFRRPLNVPTPRLAMAPAGGVNSLSATARNQRIMPGELETIQPSKDAVDATAQSHIVNRPVPMPPVIQPHVATEVIPEEALHVYAPVDLTRWPIGQVPIPEQNSICPFAGADAVIKDSASECVPPPCDVPDCDDWLGIDGTAAAQPNQLHSSSPGVCVHQAHGCLRHQQAACLLSSGAPTASAAQPLSAAELPLNATQLDPVSASTCAQLAQGSPWFQELPGARPALAASCDNMAASATREQDANVPKLVDSRPFAVACELAVAAAAPASSPGQTWQECGSCAPASPMAALDTPAVRGDTEPPELPPVQTSCQQPLAAPSAVCCGNSPETPRQMQRTQQHCDGPMDWLFSPPHLFDSHALQMSPAALMSPGQLGVGFVSAPSHEQESCTFVGSHDFPCQNRRLAHDGEGQAAVVASPGSTVQASHDVICALQAARPARSPSADCAQAAEHPEPSLELEDDDLYRIFAMTCTTSPVPEETSVPAPFMDFLLNDEDDNDLDWLDAESPDVDLLRDTLQLMSPDGPHAHTRLRLLEQDQGPHTTTVHSSPSSLPCCVTAQPQSTAPIPTGPSELSTAPCTVRQEPRALDLATNSAHAHQINSTASVAALQPHGFTGGQLRQLYAQVQAHAQLLLQTFLLASQGQVSVAVRSHVEKLWAWSDASLKSGPLREEQDHVAADSWEMLADLGKLDTELSRKHPDRLIPASVLGAITPQDCQRNPELLCKQLADGWLPVLANGSVSSLVHVPWLGELDALVHACGIQVESSTTGCTKLTQVSCEAFGQVSTATPVASKAGTFMQPLHDDPDAAPGCRRNITAFRSSPFTLHIQNVMARYAVWWNRGLFPRIDGSRSSGSGSRRKAATFAEDHFLATLVLHHGRDYTAIANAVPGWTEDWVRARLRNNKRKGVSHAACSAPDAPVDMRVCMKDIIQQTLESVDGDLTPEEVEILVPLVSDTDGVTHEFWENVATQHVPWRKPAVLERMWCNACKEGVVEGRGQSRPIVAWRAATAHTLLTGANCHIWVGDDAETGLDQRTTRLLQEKTTEYETKLIEHATVLCAEEADNLCCRSRS